MNQSDAPLTQAEVDSLPDGALIEVCWSGGNGPYRYRVTVNRFGQRVASGRPGVEHLLEFCGPKPATEVRLISAG